MIEDRHRKRVWLVQEKRMAEIDSLDYGTGDVWILNTRTGERDAYHVQPDTAILLDCTGLKDSEGNLIYEGDVLTTEDAPLCSIRWCNGGGGFEFYVYENGERHESHMHFTGHDADTGKVLGNIYEHPSLLEVEK